jgi:DNA-binding GntR family transcriptional regulator
MSVTCCALRLSRTPVREAPSPLEQHGFVQRVPRRGIFIVRQSKREIIELIHVWAALESMSARLATLHALDAEIGKLRQLHDGFESSPPGAHIDQYSKACIAFHRAIIRRGGSWLIADATENLFIHVRAVRKMAFSQFEAPHPRAPVISRSSRLSSGAIRSLPSG